tara:strand:+ start:22893 stop:23351 length:459 start_codon:yes stop_codon:yes gene_type:complete
MAFNYEWHTDPTYCLKFFLVLTDTVEENVAMHYVPGSHLDSYYRIMYHKMKGETRFPRYIPEEEIQGTPIIAEAKAGIIVIFEAGAIHRAGLIKKDKERLVIRGHCGFGISPLKSVIFNLLLKSPLNLAKYELVPDNNSNENFKSSSRLGEV